MEWIAGMNSDANRLHNIKLFDFNVSIVFGGL